MRLQAALGFSGEVIDLDTGQKVRKVRWIETDPPGLPSGVMLLEAWKVDARGKVVRDADGDPLFYQAKGRFKIVPNAGPMPTIRNNQGAPNCVRCGSVLTLPGHELCAFCNAVDKGTVRFKVEPVGVFDAVGCQRPGCDRQATLQVSDEVEASDALTEAEYQIPGFAKNRIGRLLFDRAAVVRRRWYCRWCYKPPRILDPKGEVIQVLPDLRS